MEHYLYDSILQNSVTKAIHFMDNLELDDLTHQALDSCSLLNNVSCSPVPCTPYLKVLCDFKMPRKATFDDSEKSFC